MDDETEAYLRAHSDEEPEYLHRLWRQTQLSLPYGQMASGHLQGRFLKMLTRMIRPRLVVEIGTYSGYSTLCIAEGMAEGGELHTFEVVDEQEDFTRPWLEGSPYASLIHLHIGDALSLVPELDLHPDMAFIDGDKREYVDYYEMLLPRMARGTFMVADNTLWYGHVTDAPSGRSDRQTEGIRAFNERVAKDERVERVMLPLRDGLTLIHVL